MRLHHLLLTLLFLVLSAGSGFMQRLVNYHICHWKRGICVPKRCPGSMRQIGTCFRAQVKCCRR
ncbi:hypothetical protein G4228_020395 [Cervus hanglu yarkandensis]|uniref:Beta/alpha-defensin C-terminal domain-containing protein n=1 Tax=Cervus hanglu yarkandensis TaxID=84702 RepID=A0A833SES1_9CERV|nr:hypothetical protein G4228_020395 [Cervus hanglu yarkandensis]